MRTAAIAVAAALVALISGETVAQGGMGQGKRKKCMNGGPTQMRQQMRDGSCLNAGGQRQGSSQGRLMRGGGADGTDSAQVVKSASENGASPAAPTKE